MAVLQRFTVYHKGKKLFSIFEKKNQMCVGRGLQRLEYNAPEEIYYQKLFYEYYRYMCISADLAFYLQLAFVSS